MLNAPMIRRRSAPVVVTLYDDAVENTNSTASYSISVNGWVTAIFGGVGNYQWLIGGNAADYEVRATVNSGAVSSGSSATGSWIPMTGAETWQKTAFGLVSLTIEIRRASDSVVVASCNVTIQYLNESGA